VFLFGFVYVTIFVGTLSVPASESPCTANGYYSVAGCALIIAIFARFPFPIEDVGNLCFGKISSIYSPLFKFECV